MDFIDKFDVENENIKKLLESIRASNGRLVIFAGAGVSALFGLPLWNAFAYKLIEDCVNDGYLNYRKKNDYLSKVGSDSKMLITLIYNKYKNRNDIERFYNHFEEHLKSRGLIEENELISAFKIMRSSIITTNADKTLDECAYSIEHDVFYKSSYFETDNQNINQTNPIVIHIHGSVRDKESLVFTVGQYLNRYSRTNESFYDKMNFLLNGADNTILFIGSSMSEMELLQYIVKGNNENKFILNGYYENQKEIADAEANYYEECFGIKQITYSMDKYDYKNIINFIKGLANEITLSTNVMIDSFNKIMEVIDKENIKDINDRIIYEKDAFTLPLFSKVFDYVNKSPIASEIYIDLYERKPGLFDVKKYNVNENNVQNVVMTSLSFCTNIYNEEKFKKFINKYIKEIEKVINEQNYNFENSFRVLLCYVRFINMNLNHNSKKLVDLVRLISNKNLTYHATLIYEISKYNIPSNNSFKISCILLDSSFLKARRNDVYEIEKYLKKNITSIIGYDSIGFFNKIRSIILKIVKKNKYKYFDMGAIYDYCNDDSYMSYDKYMVKLLKEVIDKMLPSDANKAYDNCKTGNVLDRKTKLYIIDRHFDILKEKITTELIDSIDSIPSVCWIIKNHFKDIQKDNEYLNEFRKKIEMCKFDTEEEIDSMGLKYILNCFLDGINYREFRKYDSKYEHYDFYNIGKHFWSSPIEHNVDKIYSLIENYNIEQLIKYINEQSNYVFDLDDAIKKYFSVNKNLENLLNNPDLFKSIINKDFIYDILSLICKENDVEKSVIKTFLLNVIESSYTESNAWIWLDIIENNKLIEDTKFSCDILDNIFDRLIVVKYEFDIRNEHFVSYVINNILFKCFSSMCDAHIIKGDVLNFLNDALKKYSSLSNYYLILSAISFKYNDIFEKYNDIEKIINDLIAENDDNKSICIFNCLIFSQAHVIKSFITTESFKLVYNKLDSQSRDYYSRLILMYYDDFDELLVEYIANNSETNVCSIIIKAFIDKRYGKELDKLLNIIEAYINNKKIELNMFKELLELFRIYPKDKRLRLLCSDISNLKYSFLDWEELKSEFLDVEKLDEDFFIKKIFEPISIQYFNDNNLYIEDEYYSIFDEIYNNAKKQKNIEILKKLAKTAFQYGLTKFKKYR